MDSKDILDTLEAHKEHYRVLPDNARSALNGLMDALKAEKGPKQPENEPKTASKPASDTKPKASKKTAKKAKKHG